MHYDSLVIYETEVNKMCWLIQQQTIDHLLCCLASQTYNLFLKCIQPDIWE